MLADIRYAFRILGKNPGFAAVAILSLALGIGANTAIFTLMDYVLLRSLPVRAPEQLAVHRAQPRGPDHVVQLSGLRIHTRSQQVLFAA